MGHLHIVPPPTSLPVTTAVGGPAMCVYVRITDTGAGPIAVEVPCAATVGDVLKVAGLEGQPAEFAGAPVSIDTTLADAGICAEAVIDVRPKPLPPLLMKLLLVGDMDVGKTNLIERFVTDEFTHLPPSTIGVDVKVKTVECMGTPIKLQIWDSSGREVMQPINRCLYWGSNGILIVYDVTNRYSFDHVTSWLHELEKVADFPVRFLVGNRCDLVSQQVVTEAEGRAFAEEKGMQFMQCSAKEGDNVEELFHAITTACLQRELEERKGRTIPTPCAILPGLADRIPKSNRKWRCCIFPTTTEPY